MKNILTRVPKVGDIALIDGQGNERYIIASTFEKASVPAELQVVGVVYEVKGNHVAVVHKDAATKKWADVYLWKVTKWLLDDSAHEVKVTFESSLVQPASTFTYEAATLSAVRDQLNQYFTDIYAQIGCRYSCIIDEDGDILVICEDFTTYKRYILGMDGLTVTNVTATEIETTPSLIARCGVNGEHKGMNFPKYYKYLYDSKPGEDASHNPAEPIKSLGTYPLSYTSYMNEIGAYARNIYGEGEEGFKRYVMDYMADYPSQRGGQAPTYRSGHDYTYRIAGKTLPMHDGSQRIAFPAANYCAEVGYGEKGLRKGCWFLPSMVELLSLYATIELDASDVISKSLRAIGGTNTLPIAGVWSSCRGGAYGAWVFSGWWGGSTYLNFTNAYWCFPCVLLDLSYSEEL